MSACRRRDVSLAADRRVSCLASVLAPEFLVSCIRASAGHRLPQTCEDVEQLGKEGLLQAAAQRSGTREGSLREAKHCPMPHHSVGSSVNGGVDRDAGRDWGLLTGVVSTAVAADAKPSRPSVAALRLPCPEAPSQNQDRPCGQAKAPAVHSHAAALVRFGIPRIARSFSSRQALCDWAQRGLQSADHARRPT